jgi:multicomponent Na+:H+ antiporter subunit B
MQRIASLIFLSGLAFFLVTLYTGMDRGSSVANVGQMINSVSVEEVGAANLVTSVVLGYRGYDTLVELSILFTAAMAAGLVLVGSPPGRRASQPAGFILRAGADLLYPLLLVLGLYIILHGHLTPGGGFQGGVILATAFFIPILALPGSPLDHRLVSMIEGLAGAAFLVIGLLAMVDGEAFLTPLLGTGTTGQLVSSGTLPLLYIAVGLKVGAELAGLLAHLAADQQDIADHGRESDG